MTTHHPVQDPPFAEREAFLYRDLARFPADLFQFDPRMSSGWLSDRYFVRTANTLAHAGLDPVVTMQLFAKKAGTLVGVWESIRMLQTQLAQGYEPTDLVVETLLEGETFRGDYAELEDISEVEYRKLRLEQVILVGGRGAGATGLDPLTTLEHLRVVLADA